MNPHRDLHMKQHDTHPSLAFSDKYSASHAQQYFEKHNDGFWRELSNYFDHQQIRKALKIAGEPVHVLDVPCGTGRFWELLATKPDRKVLACDYSQNMIDTAVQFRPKAIVDRIDVLQGSAFDLPVSDGFTDSVLCIRLIHHIGDSTDRLKLLKELNRVTKSTVIISLWVDGNIKSWRRKKLETKRPKRSYQNRFVIPSKQIEAEFANAGFSIEAKLDLVPYLSMWRTYVLKKN